MRLAAMPGLEMYPNKGKRNPMRDRQVSCRKIDTSDWEELVDPK